MQTSSQAELAATQSVNVGHGERSASIALGFGLLAFGLLRRSRTGWSLAATGATLLYRGLRGFCAVYHLLGIDRATEEQGRRGNLGVKVDRAVSMDEPAEKIYRFWRDFRNLPTIMPNLESVTVQSDTRSHWVVKGLIAWQTEGSSVKSAGSVRFERMVGGSTMVRVSLQYRPPGGELAHMITALLGEDPGARIEEDLTRLKEALGRAHEDRDGLQDASADALGYPPRR
jgi:uncharacterized membrane protein